MRVEIAATADHRYIWRIKATNGETLAVSQHTYATKQGARDSVAAVQRGLGTAQVLELA